MLRNSMKIFRRCHIIRIVRYSVALIVFTIVITALWRYLGGGGNPPNKSKIKLYKSPEDNDFPVHRVEPFHKYEDDFKAVKVADRHTFPEDLLNVKHPVQVTRPPISQHDVDPEAQSVLDYIGENLVISYKVLSNEGDRYHVNLTLKNSGNDFIKPCCWAIYLYHMKFIDTDMFNSGRAMLLRDEWAKKRNQSASRMPWPTSFDMSHVKGYTFRLKPNNKFEGLRAGESLTFRMTGGGWSVSYSEVIPNWYVANDVAHTLPRIIKSTADDTKRFVAPFDTVAKSTRSESDAFQPYSPETRYKKNKVGNLGRAPNMAIIPTPVSYEKSENTNKVRVDGKGWSIQYQRGTEDGANYIKKYLKSFTDQDMIVTDSKDETHCKPKLITLRFSDSVDIKTEQNLLLNDGYILTVSPENDCISITGPSATGLFYGAVTLVSLAESEGSRNVYSFPAVEIKDAPRYEYRGIMFDVVRNFHSKAEIMKLMEAMAMFKLNKLHLHLGDDEGWRLEIPLLPELTERIFAFRQQTSRKWPVDRKQKHVLKINYKNLPTNKLTECVSSVGAEKYGAKRGHDVRELNHLMAMLGSGPYTNTSGSGFYSVKEYREILERAKQLHIDVIPEFDMPGHSHAAINSMIKRYRTLKEKGEEREGLQYLLSDLSDESVYMSGQFFRDSAVNPCIASTYRFVELVVKSVVSIYETVSPLKVFHFGGDEVPGDAYTSSPACSQFLMRHPKLMDTKSLKSYFVRRVIAILAKYNLVPFGWEDGYSTESGYPIARQDMETKDVISQAWYNTWESGLAMRAYQYANLGYKVVMSPTTALYMDNPQEPDPEDWGLHWAARYIDTKKTFLFMPEAMYDNIDVDFMGRPLTKSQMCDTGRIQCPPLNEPKNIIGLEGATWSELIRSEEHMDTMLWPRMIAAAERAWHRADWESAQDATLQAKIRKRDWTRFANALGYKDLKRLESIGVYYYLPRPGVRVKNGAVHVNTMFPGLVVQVSTDGGATWRDFDQSASYKGQTLFATRSYDGRRRTVPVSVDIV